MIKMFGKYLGKKYRLISLLAVFGMVMEVVVENLVPLVMANLIDNGIQGQNFSVILQSGGMMVGLAIFGLIFGSIGGRCGGGTCREPTERDLQKHSAFFVRQS